MKLFADHVAEKHVNTLIRECTPSFEGPGVCLEYRKWNMHVFIDFFFFGCFFFSASHQS